MKSPRKKRSRSAEATSSAKQPPHRDSESKPADAPPAIHPPQRNLAMLSVSIGLFVIWVAYLAYVALFQ